MDIFLTAGIVLGLSSGFSPGPLTTLVISQSLQYGAREGVKVALAPCITDLPIILVSVFALTRLGNFQTILGFISILGGIFLVYLAYLSFKTTKLDVNIKLTDPQSLGKGTLVNFLNPGPYLFWLTIGAPNVVEAWSHSPLVAAGFLGGFYICLIGGKMSLAVIAANSRQLLAGRMYAYVMRILGGLLLILAFIMLREGVLFLNLLGP
ncbi:MAG: LysE family transporter [Desulfomonile tiedjei]|uniref:LysE family transporter n=1 Tax=Desulfomonile tiedjei TaxID=2358 RepID=A0A9D6YYS5_9BACT|nr:LysE family transporter [Desulfomonile tiedjei]